MPALPPEMIAILQKFAPVFSRRVWHVVEVMVIGAILAPGKRTVTAVLRVMGLSQERQFQRYHRVLNRVRWSSLELSRILLHLIVDSFVPEGEPVVVGIDETIERRRGPQIKARGIYRDPVRSSKSHMVKASGLRWVSLMALVAIPWADRIWALPFLSALAPSARYYAERQRSPKKITDWGRQLISQLRRWLPERELVVVADRSYAALELLAHCAALPHPVTLITRLRLDAARYDPAPPRQAATRGRPRLKGARQPTLAERLTSPKTEWQPLIVPWYHRQQRHLEVATATAVWYHSGKPPVAIRWVLIRDPLHQFAPHALLSTSPERTAEQIVSWFVRRWPMEVTSQETRAHLGVESQRQWSDLAIARTTPVLLGLFSLVTLFAQHLLPAGQSLPPRQAAWYTKELSTFSDTLAFVRARLWPAPLFSMSLSNTDMVKIPRPVLEHLTELLAFAA